MHWATRLAIAEAAQVAWTRVWTAAIAAAEETATTIAAEGTKANVSPCLPGRESAMWECRPEVALQCQRAGVEEAAMAARAVRRHSPKISSLST